MERTEHGASLAEIEAVYRAEATRFLRLARAIVLDEGEAQDAVHDAMALAVRERDAFRREGPLGAWLWKAVLNAARTRRRARILDPQVQAVPIEPPAERGGSGDGTAVRLAVSRLPERQRLALFLRYYADLDYLGIASVLEIRPGTVGPTLAQAQATLRQLLGGLDRD